MKKIILVYINLKINHLVFYVIHSLQLRFALIPFIALPRKLNDKFLITKISAHTQLFLGGKEEVTKIFFI